MYNFFYEYLVNILHLKGPFTETKRNFRDVLMFLGLGGGGPPINHKIQITFDVVNRQQ